MNYTNMTPGQWYKSNYKPCVFKFDKYVNVEGDQKYHYSKGFMDGCEKFNQHISNKDYFDFSLATKDEVNKYFPKEINEDYEIY